MALAPPASGRFAGARCPHDWHRSRRPIVPHAGGMISKLGLVNRIGREYIAMSFVFTVIVVVPLLAVGVNRLRGRTMAERGLRT